MIIIAAAILHADALGHRDLHMVDVAAVPDRLQDAIEKRNTRGSVRSLPR
jgi:hypothetical protein